MNITDMNITLFFGEEVKRRFVPTPFLLSDLDAKRVHCDVNTIDIIDASKSLDDAEKIISKLYENYTVTSKSGKNGFMIG